MDKVKKQIIFFFAAVFFFSWFISIALFGPFYFDIGIFFFMFFIGGLLLVFLSSFGELQDKRVLEKTPLSKIRAIAMGRVQIQGKALSADSTMKSPLSNSDCVYYLAKVQEKNPSGSKTEWKTLAVDKKSVKFLLNDGTGSVLIDPDGADIQISNETVSYVNPDERVPDLVAAFMEKHNIKFGVFGRSMLKCTECLIKPKDAPTIVGMAIDNPYVEETTATDSTGDLMISHGNQWYAISDRPMQKMLAEYGSNTKFGMVSGMFGILFFLCVLIIYLDKALAPKKWDFSGGALIQPTSAGLIDQPSKITVIILILIGFVIVTWYANRKT